MIVSGMVLRQVHADWRVDLYLFNGISLESAAFLGTYSFCSRIMALAPPLAGACFTTGELSERLMEAVSRYSSVRCDADDGDDSSGPASSVRTRQGPEIYCQFSWTQTEAFCDSDEGSEGDPSLPEFNVAHVAWPKPCKFCKLLLTEPAGIACGYQVIEKRVQNPLESFAVLIALGRLVFFRYRSAPLARFFVSHRPIFARRDYAS